MRKFLIGMFAVILVVESVSAQEAQPPQKIWLEVGGKKQQVISGEEIELDFSGKTKLKVTLDSTRTFNYGEMKFDYPAQFLFESDHDENSLSWNIEGSNLVMLVFKLKGSGTTAKGFAEDFAEGLLLEEEPEFVNTKMKLGGESFESVRFDSVIFDEPFRHAIISISPNRVLVIQHSGTKAPAEYKQLMKLLQKTFKFGKH